METEHKELKPLVEELKKRNKDIDNKKKDCVLNQEYRTALKGLGIEII